MPDPPERILLDYVAADGARARVQLHRPEQAHAAVYWLPALGVGIGPNETFADALAACGIAVAIHEWRGIGGSDRRAGRGCDWGYRELLELDLPAGRAAAEAALGGVAWHSGGHSLGGQLALIEASMSGRRGDVLLVASGQPYWRAFSGTRAAGVWLFARAVGPLTRLVGHFPGGRLGFAGREAGRLMREWAGTCLRGDYRIDGYGQSLDDALRAFAGRVLAIRMAEDRLAPPGAIDRLRSLAPAATWEVRDFGRDEIRARRPDHFGWLRDPVAVAQAQAAWCAT